MSAQESADGSAGDPGEGRAEGRSGFLETLPALARTTFRAEQWRSLFSGAIEPAFGTFLLLIAVREYQAGPTAKACLVAGPNVGYMLGPIAVALVEAGRWPVTKALSCITAVSGVFLAAGISVHDEWAYVLFCAIAGMGLSCTVPLMTQVYQDNYPASSRGKLFADAFVLRIAAATVISQITGWWLTKSPDSFRVVILVFGLAALASAFCWLRVPSKPLTPNPDTTHPLRGLRFFFEDAIFRRTLVSWMLMGVGNLIMLPLRVEQLARPTQSGFRTAAEIALLTAVIPNVARFLTSPLWGRAFDRLNFFRLRAALNLGFALAVLAFFTGDSKGWLIVGAILYGVSQAGGDVAWSLFVTKMAPPERVADYMGVHTFLTGFRGVLAPIVAFHAVERFSFEAVGWGCALLIVAANMVIWPDIRMPRRR
ncbi:MAG: MFS transporter [Verrucomicrobiota bacterium]